MLGGYGQHYQSTYTGSLVGSGAVTFAVWGYVIANAHPRTHLVELNPILLAATFGDVTPEQVGDAIKKLCDPDRKSRMKNEDGRRLLQRGEFLYFVVNHEHYRGLMRRERRNAYMADLMARKRERERLQEQTNDIVDDRILHGKRRPKRAQTDAASVEKDAKANHDVESTSTNGNPDPIKLIELMRTVAFPNLPPHDSHETERNAFELANSGLVTEESYREVCEFVAAHRGEKGVPVKPASVLQTDTVAGLLNRVHGAKDGSGDGMGRTVLELKELRESLKARLSALAEHMPLGNSAEAQEMREKWKREDANGIEYVETKKAVEDAERRIRETKP